jgi:type I site-specific restriction endonuclease
MAKGEAAKKNMFCQYSDLHNEAAVENFLVTPLVKQLGYKDSQIKFKKDIPIEKIALGSKSIKYRPDYLLYFDGKPRVVIDAKSPDESLTNWVQQISSYAITLNQQFEGMPAGMLASTIPSGSECSRLTEKTARRPIKKLQRWRSYSERSWAAIQAT